MSNFFCKNFWGTKKILTKWTKIILHDPHSMLSQRGEKSECCPFPRLILPLTPRRVEARRLGRHCDCVEKDLTTYYIPIYLTSSLHIIFLIFSIMTVGESLIAIINTFISGAIAQATALAASDLGLLIIFVLGVGMIFWIVNIVRSKNNKKGF